MAFSDFYRKVKRNQFSQVCTAGFRDILEHVDYSGSGFIVKGVVEESFHLKFKAIVCSI
jgi:hypothetical protein